MPSAAAQADLVIRNANIITIDPRKSRAQSLAVRDGKFVADGDNDSVNDLVGQGTQVLDLDVALDRLGGRLEQEVRPRAFVG